MDVRFPILAAAHDAQYFSAIGNALCQSGNMAGAVKAFRRAIEIDPNFAEAWNNLGNALGDAGQLDDAIEAYRNALRLNPRLDRTHSNLGLALREKGQLALAIAALEKAIEINPDSSIGWDNLAIAFHESGSLEQAIAAHERAIEIDPRSPMARSNFSIALRLAGRLDDAVMAAREAIAIRHDYAEAYNNMGVALADQGKTDEAIDAYRCALKFRPAYADAYTNLGASFADKGEFGGSLAFCRKAVEIDPENAHAHFNLAIIMLLTGDLEAGFEQYEWRWKCPGLLPSRAFPQQRWDGGKLNGRTILISVEQGLGDTIQFARFVPLIAERGGRVVLECQPELFRVLQNLAGVETSISAGKSFPAADVHCPIASLPGLFATTLASIPAPIPYITPDAKLVECWGEKLRRKTRNGHLPIGVGHIPQVGIAWAGRPAHRNDRNRSLHLSKLLPLQTVAAQFHSLQKGPPASQIADPAGTFHLTDFAAELTDFAETAALIANLDLVISTDTSVAHLAGAMGKPVWVLIPFNPDWRWLLGRYDTPWYPTMRLFRQRESGNWGEVIERVKYALDEFVSLTLKI